CPYVTPLCGMEASPSLLCRSLQAFAVLQWVFSFLGLGSVCLVALLLALLGRAWVLVVLYLIWLYGDRSTPRAGGRRSAWVRNWAIWRHFRDYFPISLVKTAELNPSRNYLFGFHPHGVLVVGAFGNFCTEATGFSRLFPGLRPHLLMLPCWFQIPIFRDYIMTSGLVSSDKTSVSYLLSRPGGGQVAVLAVGGPLEALEAKPGALSLRIRNQKGFVKVALEHGASLVPVYSFGENDIFKLKTFAEDSWQHLCQVTFKKLMGFSPCIFWGRGLFLANSWGLLPFAVPITTVVGHPIPVPRCLSPTEEQVDHYHALYMRALEQLFEDHKESYGVPASTRLTFL
uniref:Acyltransferase n=2 Tax=Marmota marmota marmota TaxID=9994 RepID=A0A8C5ZD42_MARMA